MTFRARVIVICIALTLGAFVVPSDGNGQILGSSHHRSSDQLPRVAMGPFVGPRASDAQQTVESVIQDHSSDVDFIPAGDYERQADQMGLGDSSNESDISRVAQRIHADNVIIGEIQRRDRRVWVVRLRVVNGRDGSVLGTASWELRSMDEMSSISSEIWDQLSPRFQRVGLSESNHSMNSGNSGTGVLGEGEHTGSSSRTSEGSAAPPAGSVAQTPGLALATLGAYIGLGTRSWRLPVLGERSPRGYQNDGYAAATISGSLIYRWAHDRAGIGVAASAFLPISVRSRGLDDSGNPVALPTSTLEAAGGAYFAYRPPGGGMISSTLGFAYHSFSVDTSMLSVDQQLAPITYLGLLVAAEAIAPVYASQNFEFGFLFGSQLRIATVGAEVRAAFGENPSTTFGLGGTAGIQLRLDGLARGLAVRATGEFLRYRTSFAGRADIGTASDSVDDFVRVMIGLSYGILTAR
jgi:hypothetical protein